MMPSCYKTTDDTTMQSLVCIETPAQTMIFPPPQNLSVGILVLSTKPTFARSALLNLRYHCAHARRVVFVSDLGPILIGRLARMLTSFKLLRAVFGDIGRPRIPFVSLTADVAVFHLSLK